MFKTRNAYQYHIISFNVYKKSTTVFLEICTKTIRSERFGFKKKYFYLCIYLILDFEMIEKLIKYENLKHMKICNISFE